jgi:membrane protein DedA with SNARE-associated domain
MVKAIFTILGGFCVYVMATLGYGGIAILMGIESACIPLPSELIMPYAGAMTVPSVAAELSAQFHVELPVFNLMLAAIAGAVGCNLGSEVAYWIGAKGGRPAIEKYGRYLLISKHELELADRWFAKMGGRIIFLGRLLPVVRTFIAFPAGVARMDRMAFHIYTFVGSVPWCLMLAYVGQRLGIELLDEHSPLKRFMHKFDALIGAVIIAAGVYFVWSRLKNLKKVSGDQGASAAAAKTE